MAYYVSRGLTSCGSASTGTPGKKMMKDGSSSSTLSPGQAALFSLC